MHANDNNIAVELSMCILMSNVISYNICIMEHEFDIFNTNIYIR